LLAKARPSYMARQLRPCNSPRWVPFLRSGGQSRPSTESRLLRSSRFRYSPSLHRSRDSLFALWYGGEAGAVLVGFPLTEASGLQRTSLTNTPRRRRCSMPMSWVWCRWRSPRTVPQSNGLGRSLRAHVQTGLRGRRRATRRV